MVAIPVLAAGLYALIPADIKKRALNFLLEQGRKAAVDYLCDGFVVPRLGISREFCHKIANGIFDRLRAASGVKAAKR